MREKKKAVSVVIPCFNGAPFLGEALESVLNQTHPALEVIVVDDGSKDESAAIAESFGPPVRVIQQSNQGESVARNRGIDEAKGEWIAFLDADNLWKPTKLEKQCEAIGPGVVCVHTNTFLFGTEDGVVDVSRTSPEIRYSIGHVCVSNPISPSSILVRRDLPTRFPVWTRYGEDLIYNLDLVTQGSICLVAEPLTGVRRHHISQSNNPAIETLWCRTVEEWLYRNSGRLTKETIHTIRQGWVRRLVSVAVKAKGERDWDQYWAIRGYLAAYSDFPEVPMFLEERIYPRWAYSFKDRIHHALSALTNKVR